MSETFEKLKTLRRQHTGSGITDIQMQSFLQDPHLIRAMKLAEQMLECLSEEFPDVFKLNESEQIREIQKDFVNFYSADSVNTFVPLAASGPWVVTTTGRVIYDVGGYGMLGLGHAPQAVIDAMARPHVMANIMTANFSQMRFVSALRKAIGFKRPTDRHPFAKFLCLNSGSEAMMVAARISDRNAALLTKSGAKHSGKKIKFLALKGGFHGRADRPGQASDSSIRKYREHLASFQNLDNLEIIPVNDVQALEAVFAHADKNGVFFEVMFIEPVMGEGNPGVAIAPEFYKRARELTSAAGTLLVCDAIQASIRVQGCVSIVDYPGFETLPAPDMETYSKAINAGQYPLSILAMRQQSADLYVTGLYGNTMTTAPRALDVAVAVLKEITPKLQENIRSKGVEFVDKLQKLQKKFPDWITHVTGCGLLLAAHINPKRAKVVGSGGLEEKLRHRGIGVIHGGENALRFTPHFALNSAEIDLVCSVMEEVFSEK